MLNEILISLILPVIGTGSSNPSVAVGFEPENVPILETHAGHRQQEEIEIMAGR